MRNRTVPTALLKQGIFQWKSPGSSAIQTFDIAKNDPRSKGIDPEMKSILASDPRSEQLRPRGRIESGRIPIQQPGE